MRPGSAMQSGELRKSLPSPIVAILGEMKWPIVLLFLVGFMVNVLQLTGSVLSLIHISEPTRPY